MGERARIEAQSTVYPGHTRILMAGKAFVADLSGALYWPAEQTLVVADLHLEKGSAFAARGQMLPPYDTRKTLISLTRALRTYQPRRVVALGDSFHDVAAFARMEADDRQALSALVSGREWIWIVGNHDPEIDRSLPGVRLEEWQAQGLRFRHAPLGCRAMGEVAGHMHPAARIVQSGRPIRRKCFVSTGERLVLPAFGAYAGGLNVLDRAFDPVFGGQALHVWMLGANDIYPIAGRQLVDD